MPCTPAVLADCDHRYGLGRAYRIGSRLRCPTLAELCNAPDHVWLRAYPGTCVCYSLKYPADAYQAFFKGDWLPVVSLRVAITSNRLSAGGHNIDRGALLHPTARAMVRGRHTGTLMLAWGPMTGSGQYKMESVPP